MRTVLVLMDSLNRHLLQCYGGSLTRTPNIDRLAQRGVTFDRHYCASMPCMPARRDLMNGRYNFLESPWGCLEPYDTCLPRELRQQREVYTHMVTDHYHYFEWLGHGYHNFFNTWQFLRGQEGDHMHPRVRDPEVPPHRGKNRRQDWINRSLMDPERDLDYPTPQTFAEAAAFIDHNHAEDDWFLHCEVFDPHEPFLSPQRYREMFGDDWNGDYTFDWPPYKPLDPEVDDAAAIAHVRKRYAATLAMADHHLGKLLDKLDEYELWEDTTVILTTDHGHLLGEHGYWAKNYMFVYEELAHIPLIIAGGGAPQGQRRQALTSTVDLMPTLLELHGATPPDTVHGRSLVPLLRQDAAHHESVLFGYFGRDINWTDGTHTYCRQPAPDSVCHHHTAMAVHAALPYFRQDWAEKAECGRYLAHSHIPVYRVPLASQPHLDAPDFHLVHDLRADPQQERPLRDEALEARLARALGRQLQELDAPPCQFTRLGLAQNA